MDDYNLEQNVGNMAMRSVLTTHTHTMHTFCFSSTNVRNIFELI